MRHSTALLRKHLLEGLLVWGPSAVCLLLMAWIFIYIQAQIDTSMVQVILARLPDAIKKLSPVPLEQLTAYPARIATFFEHPIVYLLLAFWCIGRGSDVVAGELGRGTLELLLAQPIKRLEILLSSTLVTVSGIGLFALVIWLGITLGILTCQVKRTTYRWIPTTILSPGSGTTSSQDAAKNSRTPERQVTYTPMRQFANANQFIFPAVNFFCLGIFVSGLSTCVSAACRYRWQAIGWMTGIWVAGTLTEVLGQFITWLDWLRNLSFLRAYEPASFVVASMHDPDAAWAWLQPRWDGGGWEAGPLTCDLILLLLGAVSFAAAAWVFQHRDIPTPI